MSVLDLFRNSIEIVFVFHYYCKFLNYAFFAHTLKIIEAYVVMVFIPVLLCVLWPTSHNHIICIFITVAKTVNHCLVMAQLYTQGKCHGTHLFLVQVRSMEDHSIMPGKYNVIEKVLAHLIKVQVKFCHHVVSIFHPATVVNIFQMNIQGSVGPSGLVFKV